MEDDALTLKKRGYTLGISVGEGSYAKVKSAYSEHLKTNVAIKIINRHRAPADFLEKFLPRELEILASLNHHHIVRTFDIFETAGGKVFMVMELGGQGDLLEFIKFRGMLPEDFSKKLFRQLSLAMKFIHDKDIVHRDVKCENLLLDNDFNLKVSDFGFSKRLEYEDARMLLSQTFCGSSAYASPEVLQGIPYDPKMYDVWSMAVVLFIMLCGSMPFDDSNIKKMLRVQKEHRINFPRSKPVPAVCKDLIYRMLHPDPARRIDINHVLQHSWLQGKSKQPEGTRGQQGGPSTSEARSEDGKHKKTSKDQSDSKTSVEASNSAGASPALEPNSSTDPKKTSAN